MRFTPCIIIPRIRRQFALAALFSCATVGVTTSTAQADDIDEIQRRDLALIQTQIEQIKVVLDRINDRQYQAEPGTTRIYLNIPRLSADLNTISSGIDHYLAPERLQPRDLDPLEGDYLDDRGSQQLDGERSNGR
ncbi:integrative conjugative element protein, RAQPRD family [Carnimonas bestiolae]|uniref:integrative conjugative element protein, RAQPRD family n=1 Tax=Carnimonas bestiolae TaxID=3402172 RepID=UPI003EDB7F8A